MRISRFERRGLGCISNGRTRPRHRGSAETRERFGGAVPSFDCPIVSILPKKPDATVISRNMNAESGWEPRRGAIRVPTALAEGGGDAMRRADTLRMADAE